MAKKKEEEETNQPKKQSAVHSHTNGARTGRMRTTALPCFFSLAFTTSSTTDDSSVRATPRKCNASSQLYGTVFDFLAVTVVMALWGMPSSSVSSSVGPSYTEIRMATGSFVGTFSSMLLIWPHHVARASQRAHHTPHTTHHTPHTTHHTPHTTHSAHGRGGQPKQPNTRSKRRQLECERAKQNPTHDGRARTDHDREIELRGLLRNHGRHSQSAPIVFVPTDLGVRLRSAKRLRTGQEPGALRAL